MAAIWALSWLNIANQEKSHMRESPDDKHRQNVVEVELLKIRPTAGKHSKNQIIDFWLIQSDSSLGCIG